MVNPDIWTPTGMDDIVTVDEYGRIGESGRKAKGYKASVKCPKCSRMETFTVAADETDSQDNIEDILGAAMERWITKHVVEYHQWLGGRDTPSQAMKDKEKKRDIAAALRDWRAAAKKRAASSTGKLYW